MNDFPDYKTVATSDLIPYARNSRTHSDEQVAQIAASIREFGFLNPIIVDGDNGIIAGHGRVMAAQKLGMESLPCIEASHLTDAQRKAYVIADNKLALNAGWDDDLLRIELDELGEMGFDLELTGFSLDEIEALGLDDAMSGDDGDHKVGDGGEVAHGALSDRFGVPPFSVLNAREGWWQSRKRAWLALGINSELGRDATSYSLNGEAAAKYDYLPQMDTGTSIFDPVLCELAYKWFCPDGGVVLDPFAGGSVRGIVASNTGRQYIGCELRQEQVEANRAQQDIATGPAPVWHCTDSRRIDTVCADVEADMIFSCPPYADLEVYSDDPNDLSTLGYDEFRDAYCEIIAKACDRLKEDRFACFVVGDVRDKHGNYYNFVGDTVEAFRQAGLHYYNEAILVTPAGTLPLRAGKQFTAGRKLGKTHQNVLVFVKGDGKRAAQALGECEFGDVDAFADEDPAHKVDV